MSTSAIDPSRADKTPKRLANVELPPRVRAILGGVLKLSNEEMQRWLTAILGEFEAALQLQADNARVLDQQVQAREALVMLRTYRERVVRLFLTELESGIADLRAAQVIEAPARVSFKASTLSLVDDVDMQEEIVLKEAASRAEMRCGMPLFLLGQRFGVLAARPAFDTDALPIGPHALSRMLRDAMAVVELERSLRIQLFRLFERHIGVFASSYYEAVNQFLIAQGVLPNMSYVPVRLRRQLQGGGEKRAEIEPDEASQPQSALPGRSASTASNSPAANGRFASAERALGDRLPPDADQASANARGEVVAESDDTSLNDAQFFDMLRQLMAGKRNLLGKLTASAASSARNAAQVADLHSVQDALGRLQASAPTMVRSGDRSIMRSVAHLKQELLAELRRQAPDGKAVALPEKDADTIDLVGMLFEQLSRDVRPNSLGASMLTKLQVPLLRVALQDQRFFSQPAHPARQMLNAVAEATAHWSLDDDVDRELAGKMSMVVDQVSKEFDGNLDLLERLAGDIGQQVQAQTRKAEIAERRHVEAARGKEKLETARLHAAQALESRLDGKDVPKFLQNLLEQTWGDVLALSALRGGEQSEAYRHQLDIADKMIDAAVAQRSGEVLSTPPEQVQVLREEIETALGQVGYHEEDARAVASRLLSSTEEDKDDPASRTELAIKLKQHARFGQPRDQAAMPGVTPIRPEELSPEERLQLEALKRLPFGTWLEMSQPERSERARRRMSWFSPVTGNCLLVNHRGQRVGEFPLSWLAREMVAGRAALVNESSGSLVDRAWKAIMSTLKVFSGQVEAAG